MKFLKNGCLHQVYHHIFVILFFQDYKNFANNEFTNTRKSILAAYDQLLTSKYKIQLNQKTIDRVKNYFKWLLIEASKILSFDTEAKKIKLYTQKKK